MALLHQNSQMVLVKEIPPNPKPDPRRVENVYNFKLLPPIFNYIFGAGLLTLPQSLFYGGIIMSSFFLILCSAISALTSLFLFEVQARAQAIKLSKIYNSLDPLDKEAYYNPLDGIVEIKQHRQLEITQICEVFGFQILKKLYIIGTSIYMISSTWIYVSVFSTTLSEVSEGNVSYRVSVLLFLFLQILCAFAKISTLQILQKILSAIGIFSTFMMIFISLFTIYNKVGELPKFSTEEFFFNPSKFGDVFDSFLFAQVIHTGIPLIGNFDGTKRKLPFFNTIKVAFFITTMFYLLLGISTSIVFGEDLERLRDPNSILFYDSPFLVGLSYIIQLFPCFSVFAAFPLYAIALGNELYEILNNSWDKKNDIADENSSDFDYNKLDARSDRSDSTHISFWDSEEELDDSEIERQRLIEEKEHENLRENMKRRVSEVQVSQDNIGIRSFYTRGICTIIPVFLGLFLSNLNFILTIVGGSAIFVSYLVPTYLLHQSRLYYKENDLRHYWNIYKIPFTEPKYFYLLYVFSISALVYSIYSRLHN
eukprot:snap_masked-scaffold_10-processed-gene-13.18-mRNA-1 protein AED:1.00 eAED:1.00 QI:0/0/0/0/1/1/2/0/537